MRRRLRRPDKDLWSDPDFLRLWGAQTISQVRTQVTLLALPLTAILLLLPVFVAGAILGPGNGMMFNVNRQAITPERLLGRMNPVVRFMYWGTMPAGAAAGGALATVAGVRTTLIVGAVGAAIPFLPLLFSPLRHLRALPEAADA